MGLVLCPDGHAYYRDRKSKRSGIFTITGTTIRVVYGKTIEAYELQSDFGFITLPDRRSLEYRGDVDCAAEAAGK